MPSVERWTFDESTYLVTRPHVTLYADASDDSLAAFRVLAEHNVRFAVRPADEPGKIHAMWDDLRFEGLERIRILAEVKEAVGADLQKWVETTFPERMTRSDPEGSRRYQAMVDRQRQEAWDVLAHIRASGRTGGAT